MKYVAWTIVIMGWVFYGLLMLLIIIHPAAHPTNPVEDIQRFFSKDIIVHWRANLVLFGLVMIYIVARGYTLELKERKQTGSKQHDTRRIRPKQNQSTRAARGL